MERASNCQYNIDGPGRILASLSGFPPRGRAASPGGGGMSCGDLPLRGGVKQKKESMKVTKS
jgi:hypothetical protein